MTQAREIAAMVSNMLNTYGSNNSKEFIYNILTDHPALQQRFMSDIVMRFIRDMANKKSECIDDRNRTSYEICKILYKTIQEEKLDYDLPMI